MRHIYNQRSRSRHHFCLTLALAGLMSLFALSGYSALAQVTTPSWTFTGNLNTGRFDHTATLLPNGKVLVAGGANPGFLFGLRNSAELYDPTTGTWSVTGSLNLPRVRFTATLLPSGKVLVTGGFTTAPGSVGTPSIPATNTAELYNPTTGTWSPTANMNSPRAWHSATLLPNGKVLIAGGLIEAGYVGFTSLLNTAELYDPESGTWSVTGSLNTGRGHVVHTATLLQNGKVLVVGGSDLIFEPFTADEEVDSALVSAELYDPSTGSWSVTGSLNTGRVFHTATLLPSGNILVAGGGGIMDNLSSTIDDTAELYDPTVGTWSYAGHLSRRWYHTATLLPNAQVLVAGGVNHDDFFNWTTFNNAEIYDPATGNWSSTTALKTPRSSHTATLLSNGKLLVVGGADGCCGILASTELYDSGTSSVPNPIDDAQFFVRQQYLDFLGREPDTIGFQNWVDTLTNCPNGGFGEFDNPDCDRVHVSAGFYLSEEFRIRGYWAYRFYQTSFGRAPLYTEFIPDMLRVGGSQSPDQEAVNKTLFTDEWVNLAEFKARYDGMNNADYVDGLLHSAGVTLANRDALVSSLQNGQKTRSQVLRDIVENRDVEARFFIEGFVSMQYFGYLKRDPDSIGYANWVATLRADPGNYRHMIFGFIYSTEYRSRFGQP